MSNAFKRNIQQSAFIFKDYVMTEDLLYNIGGDILVAFFLSQIFFLPDVIKSTSRYVYFSVKFSLSTSIWQYYLIFPSCPCHIIEYFFHWIYTHLQLEIFQSVKMKLTSYLKKILFLMFSKIMVPTTNLIYLPTHIFTLGIYNIYNI